MLAGLDVFVPGYGLSRKIIPWSLENVIITLHYMMLGALETFTAYE
jgi:hypothetical protein